MTAPAASDSIELKAPAKVNLHLGIYPGRDARGYHRADSIMIGLELADDIRVRRSHEPCVSYEPPLSVPVEKSAVYRAIRAFEEAYEPPTSFSVDIVRNVPGSGGLGSSSTDAAGALRGMAALTGVDLGDARLVGIARSIGADVPFFIEAQPALYVGAGDVRSRVFDPVSMPIVLVKPEAGVSTVEAYAVFDADPTMPAEPVAMIDALRAADIDAVAASLFNNLAPAACAIAPEVGECRAWLAAQSGVLGAQVTGSGSCSFAICESAACAERIAASCPWWACATRTLS